MEVLFRARRKDNHEWIEGTDVTKTKPAREPGARLETSHTYIAKDKGSPRYEVSPRTIGRYTGFTDRLGRKIFTGDDVGGYSNGEMVGGTVSASDGHTLTLLRKGHIKVTLDHDGDWLEIIRRPMEREPEQLCWDCKNACGGCAWSKSFGDVDGWHAVPSPKPLSDGGYTLCILDCPEFERDR